MKILVIGNSQGSVTDDPAEEMEIANTLRQCGHTVTFLERLTLNEVTNYDPELDIILIAVNKVIRSRHIDLMRKQTKAKIYYWMADYVFTDQKGYIWQEVEVFQKCDIFLMRQKTGLEWFKANGINAVYWPFDVATEVYKRESDPRAVMFKNPQTAYPEVVPIGFAGNWVHDPYRMKFLHELQKHFPDDLHITTFSMKEFETGQIDGEPTEFKLKNLHHNMSGHWHNLLVDITKINLSIDSVLAYGFTSTRTSKIMAAGGFVLMHDAPGLHNVFEDNIIYFNNIEDCVEKIKYWLAHDEERIAFAEKGRLFAEANLRPINRIKEFLELHESIVNR